MQVSKLSAAALLSLTGVVLPTVVPGGAGAVADDAWGPVVNLARSAQEVYGPQVETDPRGGDVAAWVRGGSNAAVFLTSRHEDGAWRDAVRVAGTHGASEMRLAVADDGERVVAWTNGRTVKAARKQPGERWTGAVVLHRTATGRRGVIPAYLELDVNGRGRAVVAWQTVDDDQDAVHAVSRIQSVVGTAHGQWTTVRTLSPPRAMSFAPQAALDRRGRATVVWDEAVAAGSRVMVAARDMGERWTEPRALTGAASHAANPQLDVLPDGELAVAWTFRDGSSSGIRLRRWSQQTGWSRASAVPGVGRSTSWLALGLDEERAATVAWTNRIGAVWAAEQSAGEWIAGRVAPAGSVFYGLALEVNPTGDAVVGWNSVTGGDHPVQAAYRGSTGWSSPESLSAVPGDAFGPDLALDVQGNATAVWSYMRDISGGGSRVQARSLTTP